MAKAATIKIRMESTAKNANGNPTGTIYVTKKNPRTTTEKLVMRKYDPVTRKHEEFKEKKIK